VSRVFGCADASVRVYAPEAFLDRWLCVGCYRHEADVHQMVPRVQGRLLFVCHCTAMFDPIVASPKIVCKWCEGGVVDKVTDEEDEEDEVEVNQEIEDGPAEFDGYTVVQAALDAIPEPQWRWVSAECTSCRVLLQCKEVEKNVVQEQDG
jgi:hypothetical protein